jgi:hypothetical protein
MAERPAGPLDNGPAARVGLVPRARLTRLMNGEAFARAFAVAYVGIDP